MEKKEVDGGNERAIWKRRKTDLYLHLIARSMCLKCVSDTAYAFALGDSEPANGWRECHCWMSIHSNTR